MGMLMSLRVKTVTGLTLLPAVAALIAGITVGVTKLLAAPDADKPTFINDFLWNPLSSSAAAAYATFIVVIFYNNHISDNTRCISVPTARDR